MRFKTILTLLALVLFGVTALAQEAKVKVEVTPHTAYIFLDDQAIGDGSRTIHTTTGKHTIAVYNYGYTPKVQEVNLEAGKNPAVPVSLTPNGDPVATPWGVIQLENVQRAAVLLNGKKPDYFVGHGDEFNHHWFGVSQYLIVPAGTHQLFITRNGQTLYDKEITVGQNQRVILYVKSGKIKTETWSGGGEVSSLPRFQSGTASATVVVAPVSSTLSATPDKINCNETTKLAWTSKDTIDATFADDAQKKDVAAPMGSEDLSPRHTTTYTFTAVGPGGVTTSTKTVEVNPVIQSSLSSDKQDAHYLKIGDQVLTNEPVNLTWTTFNADKVEVQPHGDVAYNGTQAYTPTVQKSDKGPVDESVTYTLASTNVCGGSDSKQVTLHVVGLIEPEIMSIFFPTGYPTRSHPDMGLVASQEQELRILAQELQIYFDHNPDAKLTIDGHTDIRGGKQSNLKLAQRRIDKVKAYLVAQGIAPDRIDATAIGKAQQLDKEKVKELVAQNPKGENGKLKNAHTTWLAYNRRVDVTLNPVALESKYFFPADAPDAKILWQRSWPSIQAMHKAELPQGVATSAGLQ